jgi:hypothetical protein
VAVTAVAARLRRVLEDRRSMKGITDRAGEVLQTVLSEDDRRGQKLVRLFVERGRRNMVVDTDLPALSDTVFKYKDQGVLVVDFVTTTQLAGSMLDYQDGTFRLV